MLEGSCWQWLNVFAFACTWCTLLYRVNWFNGEQCHSDDESGDSGWGVFSTDLVPAHPGWPGGRTDPVPAHPGGPGTGLVPAHLGWPGGRTDPEPGQYGAASKHINRLQRVQNALARVVTYQCPYTSPLSSTALLQNLHWLPIEWRVHFKLATLAYKALHTGQPPYLSELLQHYEPKCTLRSYSSFKLSVPWYNVEFGSHAFRITAPKIWNLLPVSIRNSPSLPTFHQHLKAHYFQSVYPNP